MGAWNRASWTGLSLWLLAAIVIVLAAPTAAGAAIVVNDAGDSGDANNEDEICSTGTVCTLRAAIETANDGGLPGSDTITFNLPVGSGEIALGSPLAIQNQDLQIVGPGSAQLTVNGMGADIVFSTLGAGNIIGIAGLTITGGDNATTGQASGVNNLNATVTLTGVNVTGNKSNTTSTLIGTRGGGISNQGTLRLISSTVHDNDAENKQVSNNLGLSSVGGGIYNEGQLFLTGSTVSDNTAAAETLAGSTGTHVADARGGGIYNETGSISIDRSTISGNTASATTAAGGAAQATHGGGVFSFNTSASYALLQSSTMTANTVQTAGPGGHVRTGANWGFGNSTLNTSVKNTLISLGFGATNCALPFVTSSGHNLEGATNTCGFDDAVTDQVGVADTGLNPLLAENLGPTKTHALISGSPAIDRGIATLPDETTDQRGFSRPSDFLDVPNLLGSDGTDIGAFELQAPVPAVPPPPPAGAGKGFNLAAALKKCRKKKSKRARKKCIKRARRRA